MLEGAACGDYIEAAEKYGAAWVIDYWPRLGTHNPVCKLTYVRKVRVGNEGLIVGAGIYEVSVLQKLKVPMKQGGSANLRPLLSHTLC